MASQHAIAPLVQRIAPVEEERPQLVLLEQLLPDCGDRPGGRRQNIRPLFEVSQTQRQQEIAEMAKQVEDAKLQAVAEVQTVNARELQGIRDRYSESVTKLEDAVASIEKVVASEVVDLALLVAEELLRAELRERDDLLIRSVEEALAQMPHEGQVRVHVAASDLGRISAAIDGEGKVEWVESPQLSTGDCVVEAPERLIDSSIESRLSAVRDCLIRTLMAEEAEVSESQAFEASSKEITIE